MARIRTIKPEFWDSPATAKAGLRARLLYIAMWNWADDWGVGDAHPKRLLSFAFPNDECSEVEPRNFRRLASELSECFGVEWYEADGRQFYAIPSWEEHQRTEKKARRANIPPDQAERWLYTEVSENPPLNLGSADDGNRKGEVGKGKGEEGHNSASSATTEFERAWQHWPKKVEKKAALDVFKKKARTRGLEQLTEDIIRFGDAYEAAGTPKQYVKNLASWLRGERWTDELPAPRFDEQPVNRIRQNLALVAAYEEQEQRGIA